MNESLGVIFENAEISDPEQLLLIAASYADFAEAYFVDPDNPDLPLKLEPGQRKAINALQWGYDIEDCPLDYLNKNPPKGIVMIWPRQFGKTTGVAIFCAVVLILVPKVKIGVMSKDEPGAKLIIEKIKGFLEDSPFKSFIERSLKLEIQMKGGGIARAHPCSEGIRGFSYNYLLMDEAAVMDDSIIEEAALHTTRKIGIRWVMLSTPKGYKGALIKYYIQGLKTRKVICKHCLTEFTQAHFENAQFDALRMSKGLSKCPVCGFYVEDDEWGGNTYFYGMGKFGVISVDPFTSSFYSKDDILEQLELAGNTPKARQELLGEIIPEGQTVFTREMLNNCVNASLKNVRVIEPGTVYWMGVDFGKVHDNSVAAVGHIDRKKRKIILDYLYIIYSEYESIEYEDIKDRILDLVGVFKPTIIAADATGMGEPIIEAMEKDLRQTGWRGKILSNKKNRLGFIFDMKSKPDLIDNLQELFARGRIEIPPEYEPQMETLYNELLNFSYEMTQANYVKYGVQLEHDDTVIAVALMAWCERSKPWITPMIEYVGRGM